MNPLPLRKQLLIAESELNHEQLVQELRIIADKARSLAKQASTAISLASAAATLIAGLVAFRRKKPALASEKLSWQHAIVKGAGLISTVWQTFCPQGRRQK